MVVDETGLFLGLLILTSAVSAGFWLDHRVRVATFPISAPDVILACYGIYGLFSWLLRPAPRRLDRMAILLTAWFLYSSVIGICLGFAGGNPVYAVLQEYRIVLYTFVAYWSTVMTFRPGKHLRVVALAIVGAGILVSAWQLAITLLGRTMGGDEIVFLTGNEVGRVLRDVNLPLYFASQAFVFVGVTQLDSRLKFLKSGWAWVLMAMFLGVPLLSMTRTIWVAAGLSAGLLLLYAWRVYWRNGRLERLVMLAAGLVGSMAVLLFAIQAKLPAVYEGIRLTLTYSLSASDDTSYQRLQAPQALIAFLSRNGLSLWTGIGFGNMGSGAVHVGPFNELHNAYLAYMVICGLPGMLLFIAMWISPLRLYRRLLAANLSPLARAYTVAALINWVVYSIAMLVMPPHWTEAAWIGATMGIASVMGSERRTWVLSRMRSVYIARRREAYSAAGPSVVTSATSVHFPRRVREVL